MQIFKRAARRSVYERRMLIEKFRREINSTIRHKLIEIEWPFLSISEWFDNTINLDRNWRENRREEERRL